MRRLFAGNAPHTVRSRPAIFGGRGMRALADSLGCVRCTRLQSIATCGGPSNLFSSAVFCADRWPPSSLGAVVCSAHHQRRTGCKCARHSAQARLFAPDASFLTCFRACLTHTLFERFCQRVVALVVTTGHSEHRLAQDKTNGGRADSRWRRRPTLIRRHRSFRDRGVRSAKQADAAAANAPGGPSVPASPPGVAAAAFEWLPVSALRTAPGPNSHDDGAAGIYAVLVAPPCWAGADWPLSFSIFWAHDALRPQGAHDGLHISRQCRPRHVWRGVCVRGAAAIPQMYAGVTGAIASLPSAIRIVGCLSIFPEPLC